MNKIDQIANYKISLHTKIYNADNLNILMENIIEEFTNRQIPILCNNVDNNILGFSVSSTDTYIIKECIYNSYYNFFNSLPKDLDLNLSKDISIEDLYNLTILNNSDRSNILLIL